MRITPPPPSIIGPLSPADYGKLKRIAMETALRLQPKENTNRIHAVVAATEAELRRINGLLPNMDKTINDGLIRTTPHGEEL